MKSVLVAMSGGVDSSCAAYFLKKEGYRVIGAHMRLFPAGKQEKENDARAVAAHLGIPFHVFDICDIFNSCVVEYFSRSYKAGRTPNPCIVCNQQIKFGALFREAKKLGCDYFATGHYVTTEYDQKRKEFILKEGKDQQKDQSYFLFLLTQRILCKILFPLSARNKTAIKKIVEQEKFPIRKKDESQEICFVPDNYVSYLTSHGLIKEKEGNIVDQSGKVLGKHSGYFKYTIGQRRGLGVSAKERLYVIATDPKKNTVTVGAKRDLEKKEFAVRDLHWIGRSPDKHTYEAEVRVRYNQQKKRARIKWDKKKAHVTFLGGGETITPGQAAVFYEKNRVLGGGWIV